MSHIETMKHALEALEANDKLINGQFPNSLTFDAIAAIEAAHGIKENT